MAITVGYEDPGALGVAAYQAGLGQYAKYQQEQALRQQAMALQERQFAEQQEQNDFRNRFAVEQLNRDQYNRNRALNLGFFESQQQLGLRQQALAQEAASRAGYNETRLIQQAMSDASRREQQQMLANREQAQIMAQADRARMQEQSRRAAADWEAIQKARADGRTFLNEGEYQQAVEQWHQMYGNLGERMPLPYVEQPAMNPLAKAFSNFLGEGTEDFFDQETGEPLIDPRLMVQLAQIKKNDEAAQMKAQIDKQNADAKAAKLAQEMQQEQLAEGFEFGQKQSEAIQKQEQQRVAEQQKQIKARADEYGKLLVADIDAYENLDPEEKKNAEKPVVPNNAYLTSAVATYLWQKGYLPPGTTVYIDGVIVTIEYGPEKPVKAEEEKSWWSW